ncbi:MAG: hypothetical protein GWN93_06025 [Deltaproteobacteria bacterium]|nr:hypothetical protein [Deltaproteobacteria bacterium]
MADQELYVFWKYDQPPYVLGAKVEKFYDDGKVEPKGYLCFHVKPITILPDGPGREAMERLIVLKNEFRQHEHDLREDTRRRAYELLCMEVPDD